MLMIYNSLSKKKEIFKPINEGKIGIYVCGLTVYDDCHLGHGRSMVCFDVVVRHLRAKGYEVTYVRNITDIDDKIIARANERKISIDELTNYYITNMEADSKALNILPPDKEPRATQHIETMIQLIQRLLDSGHAYLGHNGDVCYEVQTFKSYGKLSRKDLKRLKVGARIQVDEEKRSPFDFILWKKSKPEEPSWPSPWGPGRPGWHIECSAMSMKELGEHFDIHGGGLDLQFPHHENEIAQSEAVTKKTFANYWIHAGLLQVNHEKMAKSTGNFFTIREVLEKHNPEVIRYFFLSSHYRSPLNYTEDNLHNARKALTKIYRTLESATIDFSKEDYEASWIEKYHQAMDDDFNTPVALAVLFQLCHEINKAPKPSLFATLKYLASLLGLLQFSPEIFLRSELEAELDPDKIQLIESLIRERSQAKVSKDWARADEIRNQLAQIGIELEDSKEGTTWHRKL